MLGEAWAHRKPRLDKYVKSSLIYKLLIPSVKQNSRMYFIKIFVSLFLIQILILSVGDEGGAPLRAELEANVEPFIDLKARGQLHSCNPTSSPKTVQAR